MNYEATFPNLPTSLSPARRFVLESIGASVLSEAVALMVSELATNAIRHSGSPQFTVTVEHTGTQIRVAVTDDGTGEPVMRSSQPIDLSGRGLRIVQTLSTDWGIIPTQDTTGKTV